MKKRRFVFSSLILLALCATGCSFTLDGGGASKEKSTSSMENSDESSSSDEESIDSGSEKSSSSTSSKSVSSSSSSESTNSSSSKSSSSNSSSSKSGSQSYSQSSSSSSSSSAPATQGTFSFNNSLLNTPQEIHSSGQKAYLNFSGQYYYITKNDLDGFGATGSAENSSPNAVSLSWDYTPPSGKTVSKYSIVYGQYADLSDGYQIDGSTSKSLSFYNPYLGDNYFRVIATLSDNSKDYSAINTFKVDTQAPRNLKIGNLSNCRDMGGRTTYAGGKIKQGLIYRTCGNKFDYSTEIDNEGKKVMLEQLGVKTEINVSNDGTYNMNLTGVQVKSCCMDYGATPYSNFSRNAEKIRNVFEILADESNYPVFYHCRIGTDRTGITGICINGLLGVPFNEILQDYGFSNFGKIGGQRYANKPSDPDGDDCAKYVDEILKMPGENFQEQTYNALLSIGLSAQTLNKVINFMTEGTKATLPNTEKIGIGNSLVSTGSKSTDNQYNHPNIYYPITSGQSVKYTSTFTAGQKDVVVYLGSLDSSDSTKLASSISLKIDNQEKSIVDKTLFKAGFGQTKNNKRTGYMFNLLGTYELSAGQHTIEIAGKSSTAFNIGTICVFNHTGASGEQGGGGEQPAAHDHSFSYGSTVSNTGETSYKIGACECGKKDVCWSVIDYTDISLGNQDSSSNYQSVPCKLNKNNTMLTFEFTLTEAINGSFYIRGWVDHYEDSNNNKNKGFFANSSGNSASTPNIEVYYGSTKVEITNKKTYAEMGVKAGENEAAAALCEVGAMSLVKGKNTITLKRLGSYTLSMYDLHVIG